jgi:hypothetical protein
MIDTLEDLLSQLRSEQALFMSGEEATKQGVVLPILSRLGWNRDNIREVVPEYMVGNGRVDYCLKIGEQESVFVEVKRTNEDLEKHQIQLLEYAFRNGVKIAALTNGFLWWLYLPLFQGSWEQRKFFAIDIQQQEVSAVAQHFREFLNREAVANGTAVKKAEEIHAGREKVRRIQDTIPKAWHQLCEDPDEILLELFADKVESLCGYRPDQDMLANYLRDKRDKKDFLTKTSESTSPEPGVVSISTNDGIYTDKKPVSFTFRGEYYQADSFKDILINLCRTIYHLQPNQFDNVLTIHGRKRAYFGRTPEGMTSPSKIPDTGIYIETNLCANDTVKRCYQLLSMFGYAKSELQIKLNS